MTWEFFYSEQCQSDRHGYCSAGKKCDCKCHSPGPLRQEPVERPTDRPFLFCRHKDHRKCPALVEGLWCPCRCHAKAKARAA